MPRTLRTYCLKEKLYAKLSEININTRTHLIAQSVKTV